jgi:hypothetical protein
MCGVRHSGEVTLTWVVEHHASDAHLLWDQLAINVNGRIHQQRTGMDSGAPTVAGVW